jgi:hypothetical protein
LHREKWGEVELNILVQYLRLPKISPHHELTLPRASNYLNWLVYLIPWAPWVPMGCLQLGWVPTHVNHWSGAPVSALE